MAIQLFSPLPRELRLESYAVPTSATLLPGTVATSLVDVERVSVSNSSGATRTFTLTDNAGNIKGNLSVVPIDVGGPASFEFKPPIRCTGVKVTADASGLRIDVDARMQGGFTGITSEH